MDLSGLFVQKNRPDHHELVQMLCRLPAFAPLVVRCGASPISCWQNHLKQSNPFGAVILDDRSSQLSLYSAVDELVFASTATSRVYESEREVMAFL
jgi:hypothetical protein